MTDFWIYLNLFQTNYRIPACVLLSFVTLERLCELWIARRNTELLFAKGAVEMGSEHYPLIVALHAIWLMGLWLLGFDQPLEIGWLIAFIILQILRVWTLKTLGERWTTRIIILPNVPLVKAGPYRFVSHPNYLVVIAEIAILPMCFQLPYYAAVFSILNLAILYVRIEAEGSALQRTTKFDHV